RSACAFSRVNSKKVGSRSNKSSSCSTSAPSCMCMVFIFPGTPALTLTMGALSTADSDNGLEIRLAHWAKAETKKTANITMANNIDSVFLVFHEPSVFNEDIFNQKLAIKQTN